MKKKLTGIVLLLLFFAMPLQGQAKVKGCAAQAADDVHKVGYIVLHEQNIIYLLAQVECTDKDQSDRNTAVPAAGQAGQHDEHKYNAGHKRSHEDTA